MRYKYEENDVVTIHSSIMNNINGLENVVLQKELFAENDFEDEPYYINAEFKYHAHEVIKACCENNIPFVVTDEDLNDGMDNESVVGILFKNDHAPVMGYKFISVYINEKHLRPVQATLDQLNTNNRVD